jgi:hypothetical protein
MCVRYLPAYLNQAGANNQSIRRLRLSLKAQVDLAEQFTAALKALPTALAACKDLKGGDAARQSCEGTVVSLARPLARSADDEQTRDVQGKAADVNH